MSEMSLVSNTAPYKAKKRRYSEGIAKVYRRLNLEIEGLKETKNDGFEGLEWKNEKNLM